MIVSPSSSRANTASIRPIFRPAESITTRPTRSSMRISVAMARSGNPLDHVFEEPRFPGITGGVLNRDIHVYLDPDASDLLPCNTLSWLLADLQPSFERFHPMRQPGMNTPP